MGGFIASPSPSPSPKASEDEDANDGSGDNDEDEDEDKDASSSSDEEMTVSHYPLSFVTKRGSSFRLKVVMYLGGVLA